MNIMQEGLGVCSKHGTPILGQVGVKGSKICFACQEEAIPKTGKTVIVKEENQDGTGKVTIMDVAKQTETTLAVPSAPAEIIKGEIVIRLAVGALSDDPVKVLLQSAYEAIDNMPPFATLKETKQAIKLQEDIQALLVPPAKKRKPREPEPPSMAEE